MLFEELADPGPCCACRGTEKVRNFMMLDRVAPVAGTGWGCFECDLPLNGAMAAVCDDCLKAEKEILDVFNGFPKDRNRISIKALSPETFQHDYLKHPELWWFEDSPDTGSPDCICSICRQVIEEGEVPIRIVQQDMEARFHDKCFKPVEEAFR